MSPQRSEIEMVHEMSNSHGFLSRIASLLPIMSVVGCQSLSTRSPIRVSATGGW